MVRDDQVVDVPSRDGSSFLRDARLSRRTIVAGTAWAVPALVLAQSAPAFAASFGCQVPGTLFDSQARGRLLSGTIGGANLDAIASVEGAHALELAGGGPSVTVSSPLTVSALDAISLNLLPVGTLLSSVLTNLAGVGTGVVNQYAYAHESGEVIGASGAVNDQTGAINLNTSSTGVPQLASLELRTILAQATGNPAIAALVAAVADLDLQIGALAGRAWMDSLCIPPNENELTRDYLIAYLRLVLSSPVIGTLSTALTTLLGTIQVDTNAIFDILEDIPILGPVLAALGSSILQVQVTTNTSVLTATPIPNAPNAALQVDLGAGTATIDVASLLGGAYSGEISPWLNGLPPNSRLFIDYALPTGGVTALLDAWVDALLERLKDLVSVQITANVANVLQLNISGTLRQLLEGGATAAISVYVGVYPLGTWVTVNLPVGTLASIGNVVFNAVDALLRPNGVLNAIFTPLNGLLSALFTVLQSVLVLTVNAQNEATGVVPNDLAVLPTGRYDVAALHLGLVGFLDLLDLFLARGSVGQNEPR